MADGKSTYTIVLNSDVQNFIKGFDNAARELKGFVGEIAAIFGVGIGIHKLVELTKEAINSAEALGKLAQQTTFTESTLSAIREQADEVGISFEGLENSLALFTAKLQDAREKGGAAMDVFRNIGNDVAVAAAQGAEAEKVYGMIAQKFKEGAIAGREQAIANDLFGKSFKDWILILNQGTEGLEKMREEGKGLAEAVGPATEFNQSVRELKDQVEKLFLKVAIELLPTLQEFVQWLREFNTEASNPALAMLVNAFKALTTVVLAVKFVFVALGTYIGVDFEYALGVLHDGLLSIMQVFRVWLDTIKRVTTALWDLVKAGNDASKVLVSLSKGDFKKASDDASRFLARVKSDLKEIGSAGKDGLSNTLYNMAGFAARTLKHYSDSSQIIADGIKKEWESLTNALALIWHGAIDRAPTSSRIPKAPSGNASSSDSMTSKQLQDRMKELQLLREIEALSIKQVETDPYKLQSDKVREILPLLAREYDFVQKQIDLQKQFVPVTDDERVKVNTEIVRLQGEQLKLQREFSDLNDSQSFVGTMTRNLVQFNDAVTNLAANGAALAMNTLQSSIAAVTDSIYDAITRTRDWGQAWASAMQQAVKGIIGMVAQYIAGKLAMMAVDTAFNKKNKKESAQSMATSLPAGIAKAGEQGGWVGILLYIGVFLAAMAALSGIVAGISGGFKSGGYTGDGSPDDPAGTVHKGEFVMDANTTKRVGVPFLEQIRRGAVGASQLYSRVAIPTPITSQDTSEGRAVRQGMLPGGGNSAPPEVTVQGHKMVAVFPQNTKNDIKRAIEQEGAGDYLVQYLKGRRMELGINT